MPTLCAWRLLFIFTLAAKAALNCTEETHDPIATPCCVAQDAWDSLVAGGGCGGSGPTEAQCSAAMDLCLDCQAAVQYYSRNATALRASDVTVDISSAKIKYVLPQWDGACSGTVQGLGVGLLILTGIALLLVATGLCIAFDWRLLPSLVARQRRKLLVEAIAAQDAEQYRAAGEAGSPSAPLPPKPVPPAPPTPTARPQGFDAQPELRRAAEAVASPTSPAVLETMEPNESVAHGGHSSHGCEASSSAFALGRAQPELPKTLASQRRPRHYASAYALHTAFITIAVIAVVLRVAYVVARGLLVVGLHLAHQCLPELLLCILPLAWVSCTSRRPKSSTTAVPMSVAYWGPWQAIPRFTTYAVCTICTEIYSTLVAALAVARLPCNASPVAGVLLYCVGLLVAVVRAYCAVLALRLQDELASVCRRARPRPRAAPAGPAGPAEPNELAAAWDAPRGLPRADDRSISKEKATMASLLSFGWARPGIIEDTVRDFNEPDDPAKAALCCACLPDFVCPVLRRRLVGRRILAGGILLALLSASASAFILRAVLGEQRPKEARLSSCDAAQNGTSTCSAWRLAGVNVTDPTGLRKMDLANSITECCRGCDEVKGCQGWIFEHLDKRCRWVHFVDEVCNENPGALSCRCFTSRGIAFSFKPPARSHLIWVDTNWE